MRLSEMIDSAGAVERADFADIEVNGISTDSRTVEPGGVFIAVRGMNVDGHDFVMDAERRGASALVVQRPVSCALPCVLVEDTAVAAALMAKRYYGDPAAGLVLAGITGTNGKTSTSFMMQSILERAVGPTGLIGTIGFGPAGRLAAATHTTPAPIELYRIIAGFRGKGCRAVVMEVSSHAADQGRITGLEFDVGVFTNITRDHLDYHGTFERYVEAKEIFVKALVDPGRRKDPGILVYNGEDAVVSGIAERFTGRKVSFGSGRSADVRMHDLEADMRSTRFRIETEGTSLDIELSLLGSFNAYNALAAAAASRALGAGKSDIKEGIESVSAVPGRFEVISGRSGETVVVDYAHTPDALENLLKFCRELGPRRVITVFGCGGDRDRGKRPMMGKIAVDLSDVVYVTDDNPRTEDPDGIVGEIVEGMSASSIPVHVIRDRGSAIRKAIAEAGGGDLVVLAGKGHETCQIVHGKRLPFCDAEEARNALKVAEVDHQG